MKLLHNFLKLLHEKKNRQNKLLDLEAGGDLSFNHISNFWMLNIYWLQKKIFARSKMGVQK